MEPLVLFHVFFSSDFSLFLFYHFLLMSIYLLQTLLEKVVKVKVAKPATAGNLSFYSNILKSPHKSICICKMANFLLFSRDLQECI